MKKIIQISTAMNDKRLGVFALCDNGELWLLEVNPTTNGKANWSRVLDIPQDEEKTPDDRF